MIGIYRPRVASSTMWVATGLVCASTAVIDPYHGQGIPCPFHALTGLYCPFCGMSRALYSLCHTNLAAAWAANPLFIIALPVLLYQGLALTSTSFGGLKLWHIPTSRRTPYYALAVLILFGVLRNLPWPLFHLLGPPR
jgi:hypothetical protein